MKADMIPGKVNFLGRRGEHLTRVMRFYIGDVLRDYPGAEITVLNKRPGDTDSYPVAGAYCVMDGDWLEWTVQSGDLATEGMGKCEMRATVDGQIALSIVYTTEVKESLDGAEEPPEPWESWVEQVTEAARRAESAAELLENVEADAETLEPGSPATAEYSEGKFTFGIPRGEKGEKGDRGQTGDTGNGIANTVLNQDYTLTITFTDGTSYTTESIRGAKGEKGDRGQTGDTGNGIANTVLNQDYTLTITFTDGTTYTTGSIRGAKGDKGNTGNTGPTGATPNFSIGTVATGEPGSSAAATISGTPEAPVLNLTIPRGDKGETGEVSEEELEAAIEEASSALKSEIDGKAPVIYQDASGDIVTVTDGADGMPLKECVVSVDPVQDLHGQDNPYPAGASKNVWDFAHPVSTYKASVTENANGTFAVEGTGAGANLYYIINTVADQTYAIKIDVSGESGNTSIIGYTTVYDGTDNTGTVLMSDSNTKTTKTFTAASGNAYLKFSVTGGSGAGSATVLNPMIEAGSSRTAYAPYANICPITGWTGAQISRTGKNLCKQVIQGFPYTSNQTIYIDNDTESAVFYAIAGQTYCRSASVAFNRNMLAHVATYEITNGMPYTDIVNQSSGTGATWTATWTGWTVWYCSASKNTSIEASLQVEIGSTASAYTPYTGTVYPISWQTAAGTVYGGTVDTVTGVLTVTFGYDDLGDLSWSKDSAETTEYGNYSYFYATPSASKARNANFICTQYETVEQPRHKLYNNQIGVFNTNSTGYLRFAIRDDRYANSTADQFATAMDGVYVAYELLEPYTVTLSPVEVKTLLGLNNIWSDTGAISLTYPADTQTYVDTLVQTATDPDGNVVQVSGSTPSITGESGKRYVCGTVDSISITPPQTGIIDVVFTSGTTPAVLTVPSSVKFPAWFDATSLDASTTYEINIADGVYGAVMAWT